MRSFRPEKIASLIRDIVSEMIADKLQDPRISRFASVTRVEVTGDLHFAKIYVSVLGDEADERTTLRGLNQARGVIQRAVARAVTARTCPQIQFIHDVSIKRSAAIIRLIDESVGRTPGAPEDEPVEPETSPESSTGPDESANPSPRVH